MLWRIRYAVASAYLWAGLVVTGYVLEMLKGRSK